MRRRRDRPGGRIFQPGNEGRRGHPLEAAVGVAIPFSSAGQHLGFSRLPTLYWPLLALSILSYAMLTQGVKTGLLRMRWI